MRPYRQRDELEFQIALGQAFQAVKGPASPEAGEAYARARTLCEQLNKPRRRALAGPGFGPDPRLWRRVTKKV